MTGLHYPDNLYADALYRPRQGIQGVPGTPIGAYRSTDPVTKPAHYQRAGIETIDYIRATLDGPGFEAYCIGNVLKYVSRYREKGGVEDLRKAQVYLGWAIQPVDGKRQSQPEGCNPAAMREAKIAYDVACDGKSQRDWPTPQRLEIERVPKWDPAWRRAPNCDGLSARDIRAPHPMASEVIRDHDERLAGGEDRL